MFNEVKVTSFFNPTYTNGYQGTEFAYTKGFKRNYTIYS